MPERRDGNAAGLLLDGRQLLSRCLATGVACFRAELANDAPRGHLC